MASNNMSPLDMGLESLRNGDAKNAFTHLNKAINEGCTDINAFMGMALAARALSEYQPCLIAIEKCLKVDPANLEALLLKADALKGLGRRQEATSFYFAAINAASQIKNLSPIMRQEINRAQMECQESSKIYEEFLREHIKKTGITDGKAHSRTDMALDIMFGRKQIYYQQPLKFYFPELPQIQFYNKESFPWAESIESGFKAIKEELEHLLSNDDGFEPYVAGDSATPTLSNTDMMGNKDWTAFHLIKDGHRNEENIAKCPQTMKILQAAPIPKMSGKSPTILFSRLLPGAVIPPHTGLINTRLICHLPLIVPSGCTLRVGNQERTWEEGELLIFDDSIEHDARNNNSHNQRVILLFDIWRPELHEEERAMICTLFEAIESYGNAN